jgi:polyisoprenoid-binding protein YceI
MKRVLRSMAVGMAIAAVSCWLATGANRGWTKTSIPKKTLDEVTGIEAITYEKGFVPGVDFLGATLLGAGVLASASLLFRSNKPRPMHLLNRSVPCLLICGCLSLAAHAAPLTFDFKDPKGVNNAVFKLDAPLEAINGSANGITGSVVFDPENPAATTGKIVVASSSLHVPNSMMNGHMQGDQWMDVAKYPEITFEAKQLKNVRTSGGNTTADVQGTLTIHGVAKELTVPIKLSYLPDKLSSRVPNMKGDLLVIRSNFPIQRSQFGINPKAPEDKVSDIIDLTLSIAGACPK